MPTFGDIVAYMYRADLYGPECIIDQVWVGTTPRERIALEDAPVEDSLNILADSLGIDREDERSFDSGTFPKVVLYDNLHDQGRTFHCGACGRELP